MGARTGVRDSVRETLPTPPGLPMPPASTRILPSPRSLRPHAASAVHTAHPSAARAAASTANSAAATETTSFWRGPDPSSPAWRDARERCLRRLLSLVGAIRWPLTEPTPEALHASPHAVQVASDRLAEADLDDLAIPQLIEAYARAERLGLDWGDSVHRAIAERAIDEELVRRLLAAGS